MWLQTGELELKALKTLMARVTSEQFGILAGKDQWSCNRRLCRDSSEYVATLDRTEISSNNGRMWKRAGKFQSQSPLLNWIPPWSWRPPRLNSHAQVCLDRKKQIVLEVQTHMPMEYVYSPPNSSAEIDLRIWGKRYTYGTSCEKL